MINRNDWFEDFQKNMSELIAKSPAADIERNVKAMMAQTFSRLDLVTREEFDVQAQLLERALARITALESRVQALEGRPDTPLQQGPSASGTS
ncbi:MAG: accessory factor UbiK family protein [Pusillimonas sp.]